MPQPHKHKDIIIAWANGATIEFRNDRNCEWKVTIDPQWYQAYEYRIKPKEKVKKYIFAYCGTGKAALPWTTETYFKDEAELRKQYPDFNFKWIERIDASMIEVEEE